MKNFELISFPNADELALRVASLWLDEIESTSRAGKSHCVALSGGRIAQKFFASVVEQNKTRKISFKCVHFFWADERCVPPTDPESNFKMANNLLFGPLKISENQIHRLRGEELPEAAVKIAEGELCQFAPQNKDGVPVLDLIFLGIGEDGHVASLFQNAMTGLANRKDFFLFVNDSPKPPPRRITVNVNVIAAAKAVWILASGNGKEFALKDALNTEGKTPAARVIQSRAKTKIFTDIQL
jgi:6-phosphogluconolactonase